MERLTMTQVAAISDECEEMIENIRSALESRGMGQVDVTSALYPATDCLDVADGLIIDARARGVHPADALRCYGYVADEASRLCESRGLDIQVEIPALSAIENSLA